MKAYHLAGSCAGRPLRLLGVGAVFTPAELRRRGHAAEMLKAAMDDSRASGSHAAVLFSDIDAGYYVRLRLRALESRDATVEAAQLPPRAGARPPFAPDEEELTTPF